MAYNLQLDDTKSNRLWLETLLKGGEHSQEALSKKLNLIYLIGGKNMKKSAKKNKKGFTLIELLIVVAIIAILAAIAIPQFSTYRVKGYNAAASSDVRNAKTAEEALFADFQGYGDSAGIKTVGPATFTTKDTSNNSRTISVGMSNGVDMYALTGDSTGAYTAGQAGSSYLVFTKHEKGDRVFAADGNTTTLYWTASAVGTLTDPGIGSTSNSDISGGSATSL
jgi:prepilin-type N-terminal cleavage/methylation domain-containing protein